MEASRDELLCSQLLPLWNEISVWAELGEHHDYRVPAKLSIITNSYFHCCCAPVQNRSLSPTWKMNFMTCDSTRTWTWPLTPLITEGGLYLYLSMYAWDSSSCAHMAPAIHNQKVLNIHLGPGGLLWQILLPIKKEQREIFELPMDAMTAMFMNKLANKDTAA